ncbi:MAG TPA: phosphoribosylglycinamide formyltransferase [Actinomycetota bacterium]|nr:phosphoribosylglycinamide formyltransferase [Actinomycetota bacterium]
MHSRIAVLVSGEGSNMVALLEACDEGRVPGSVVLVASDRPCKGIETARERGVETATLAPADYGSRDEWSAALGDVVGAARPDLVVSAGFMRILAPVFVDAFAGRLINLHPSLLPAFPGAHGVRDALEYGVKITGSTVHFVDHHVDHGPILLQEPVVVEAGDTEQTLHDRIKAVEHRLLPEACRLVLEQRVRIENGRTLVEPERAHS